MFKLEAKIMVAILFAPHLFGIIAGFIGQWPFKRSLDMKITCYLNEEIEKIVGDKLINFKSHIGGLPRSKVKISR